MASDLEQVIADWRDDAAVLRRHGQIALADQLETCAAVAEESATEWLTWLSETEAMLRSGRSRPWLRARFPELERDGHARLNGRERQFRAAVISRRYSMVAASEAGRAAALAAREHSA